MQSKLRNKSTIQKKAQIKKTPVRVCDNKTGIMLWKSIEGKGKESADLLPFFCAKAQGPLLFVMVWVNGPQRSLKNGVVGTCAAERREKAGDRVRLAHFLGLFYNTEKEY